MQFYCSSYIGAGRGETMGIIKLGYSEIETSFRKVLPRYIKPSPSYFRSHFIKINTNWEEKEVTPETLYNNVKECSSQNILQEMDIGIRLLEYIH